MNLLLPPLVSTNQWLAHLMLSQNDYSKSLSEPLKRACVCTPNLLSQQPTAGTLLTYMPHTNQASS